MLPENSHPAVIADWYLKMGLTPMPTKPCSKDLAFTGKLSDFTPDLELFNTDSNITLRLGATAGHMIDVDFDWKEAALVYDLFLPPSWVFGRREDTELLVRHTLLRCEGVRATTYSAPKWVKGQKAIVEILTSKVLSPGSVHESGQPLIWVTRPEDVPLAEMTPAALQEAVARIAGAALLLRTWSELEGGRHNIALALPGAMVRAGWDPALTRNVLERVIRLAEDPELNDRRKAIGSTLLKAADGEEYCGLPKLAEAMDEDLLKQLTAWWKLDDSLCGVEVSTSVTPHPTDGPVAQLDSDGIPPGAERKTLKLVTASEVEELPLEWTWPGVIPKGMLTVIAGDPGLGKSMMTMKLAAHVTRGLPFPVSKDPCEIGDVILLSSEDDLQRVVIARLRAAGADLDKVHAIQGVQLQKHGKSPTYRSFNISDDLQQLESALEKYKDTRLVVIDPVSAHLGRGVDSHNDAEVRAVLTPIQELAQRHQAAVVGVAHFNKSSGSQAIHRVMGSLAFVSAARAAWGVKKDLEDEDRRLVLSAKQNLAPDTLGFAYTVKTTDADVPYIVWEDSYVVETLNDVMEQESHKGTRSPARDEAENILLALLADGPMTVPDIQAEIKGAGLVWITVTRAKKNLGIVSSRKRDDPEQRWEWRLPETDN